MLHSHCDRINMSVSSSSTIGGSCDCCSSIRRMKMNNVLSDSCFVPNNYVKSCVSITKLYDSYNLAEPTYWSENNFNERNKEHGFSLEEMKLDKTELYNHALCHVTDHQPWNKKCNGCRNLGQFCFFCISTLKLNVSFFNYIIEKYDK